VELHRGNGTSWLRRGSHRRSAHQRLRQHQHADANEQHKQNARSNRDDASDSIKTVRAQSQTAQKDEPCTTSAPGEVEPAEVTDGANVNDLENDNEGAEQNHIEANYSVREAREGNESQHAPHTDQDTYGEVPDVDEDINCFAAVRTHVVVVLLCWVVVEE